MSAQGICRAISSWMGDGGKVSGRRVAVGNGVVITDISGPAFVTIVCDHFDAPL